MLNTFHTSSCFKIQLHKHGTIIDPITLIGKEKFRDTTMFAYGHMASRVRIHIPAFCDSRAFGINQYAKCLQILPYHWSTVIELKEQISGADEAERRWREQTNYRWQKWLWMRDSGIVPTEQNFKNNIVTFMNSAPPFEIEMCSEVIMPSTPSDSQVYP